MIRSVLEIEQSRRTVLAGFMTVTAGFVGPAQAQSRPVGQVTAAQGAAFLERASARLPAAPGSALFLEDLATTRDQSRLDLRLGGATRIRLGSNAALRIDRLALAAAAVTLQDGPALIERGAGAEPGFTLRSPFALIAARGTVFFAGPSNGRFGVFVQAGAVDVRTPRGTVRLAAGQGTDIAAPGAAPTAPKLWGLERIQAALASVS